MISGKTKSRAELAQLCEKFRQAGKTIGFTSGAFDLLHAGHVDYLEKARTMCDILIVAINSDKSIQKYKGSNRPIIGEAHRMKIVAALESVDFVFLFSERRNATNIEQLKPNIYFKAGDYDTSQLTSKELVEKYGGEVKLIPLIERISTTSILNRLSSVSGQEEKFIEEQDKTVHLKTSPPKMAPAIFLDRDGTINKEIGYISDPDDFELLPNALAGMKKFSDMGYRLVIITNQAGIGLGYFSKEDFYRVNKKMFTEVSKEGILFDKIYFCPHSKSENCPCRKPKTALIERARQELNIDLKNSYFIGDSPWDIEAGKNAGTRTILVANASLFDAEKFAVKPDFIVKDLLDAADLILKKERSKD